MIIKLLKCREIIQNSMLFYFCHVKAVARRYQQVLKILYKVWDDQDLFQSLETIQRVKGKSLQTYVALRLIFWVSFLFQIESFFHCENCYISLCFEDFSFPFHFIFCIKTFCSKLFLESPKRIIVIPENSWNLPKMDEKKNLFIESIFQGY